MSTTTIAILQGQVQRITGAGKEIRCTDGEVWITQDGLLLDAVLSEGDALTITTAGLTLVNATKESTIVVTSAGTAGVQAPSPSRTRSVPRPAT